MLTSELETALVSSSTCNGSPTQVWWSGQVI